MAKRSGRIEDTLIGVFGFRRATHCCYVPRKCSDCPGKAPEVSAELQAPFEYCCQPLSVFNSLALLAKIVCDPAPIQKIATRKPNTDLGFATGSRSDLRTCVAAPDWLHP
jgi:hypothetical protein